MEHMIHLERKAAFLRDPEMQQSKRKTCIYIGGLIASLAMSKLPALKLAFTHCPCPGTSVSDSEEFLAYTGVHPSHHLMSRGSRPALNAFIYDMAIIKALASCTAVDESKMQDSFNACLEGDAKDKLAAKQAVADWLQEEGIDVYKVLQFRPSGLYMTNVKHLEKVKKLMVRHIGELNWKENIVLFLELSFTSFYIEGTDEQIQFTISKMTEDSNLNDRMLRILLRRCKSQSGWTTSHQRMAGISEKFPNAGQTFIGSDSAWSAAAKTTVKQWEILLERFAVLVKKFPNAGQTFIGSNSAWSAAGKTTVKQWEILLERFAVIVKIFPNASQTVIGSGSAWSTAGKNTDNVVWDRLVSRFSVIKNSPYIGTLISATSAWFHIKTYTDDQWCRVKMRLDGLIQTPISASCFYSGTFWDREIVNPSNEEWAEYVGRVRVRNKNLTSSTSSTSSRKRPRAGSEEV